ncbi:suppressor of fused domain protein [Solirubrobacter ginsenosidimutans]|uniref:Suppressor of fused domain protein n=1 Tax=Solirubrobacter ginsenosidimutans TaxID=490573 RepID=A0A9X3S8G3_9ACTN|nr:suppressor of fused domain protein [Solirubrobacter ginsenosidimutans]MDA0166966.1 suppressor of fused domain protein [Solirubrobacter ginsenosidimutans]
MSTERSKSGVRMLRHTQQEPAELVSGDQALINAISDHIEHHFGPVPTVFHEIVSPHAHIDLHVVVPTKERPAITVVTSGMSERPMANGKYAELMLILPPSWPTMDDPAFQTDEGYWPYRLLKELARLPHEFGTSIGLGDTVPHGDPPSPYARNTKLCGALIAPMVLPNEEGAEQIVHDGREIDLLAVWPLHKDEMQVKLDDGLDRLFDLLDEARITEILEPDRPSVVPKRRRGLFRRP